MSLAQVKNPLVPPSSPLSTEVRSGADIIGDILIIVINVLFVAGVVAFIFWFILGAIRWIMSSGDKAQIETARNQIINAVIGLVILFSLFAILQVLHDLFGIDFLHFEVGLLKIKPQ